jgi:hypothetical protein
MPKDFHLLLDLLFYFVFPILCWEIGREYLPDYIAMILSTLPGVSYSFFRFLKSNELNFTRKFLLFNILAGLFIDLLSGSALSLLWNNAFYSLGLTLAYLISCFFNKPLFLYFSLDILVEQGYDRRLTKELFFEKGALKSLKTLTLLNGIREFIYALLLISLISKYGVEIYSLSILIDQFFSFLMSGVTITIFIYLYKHLNEIVSMKKMGRPARKRPVRLLANSLYCHFERCYFFIYNHH